MGKKTKINPTVKLFDLKDLNPAVYNPRIITDDALSGLGYSIKKFGCVELIVVNIRDGRNVIIGGHQRYKVLVSEKVKSIQCVAVDLSVADEKLFVNGYKTLNLSYNNPSLQGEIIDE